MEITGTQTIPAPPQVVWDALNDPAVLQKCLPGCEKVDRSADDAFQVVMRAAVGPLRARFNGKLQLTEAQAPSACVMVFEGQGGAVGFGRGTSSITLRPHDAGTELSYAAQAHVGGKLAQVGSRLIDGVARKMSDDFFNALRRQLAGEGEAAPTAHAEAASAARASEAGPPAVPVIERPGEARPAGAAAPVAVEPAMARAAAAAAVPVAPPAMAAAATAASDRVTLVPGWWLAVAALLGSATTLAGALLLR